MRIALFGGSFDPPHRGHIGIAEAAIERLSLDRVLMAPVGRQPLKRGQKTSPFEDRLEMVQLACAGHPRLAPSLIDAPRLDGGFNYSYDTLVRLRETVSAEDELFCLVGADSLQTLRHWHRAAGALVLAQWIVAARPGFMLESLAALLPAGVAADTPERREQTIRVRLTCAAAGIPGAPAEGTLWLLPDLQYEVSATAVRAALAAHRAGLPQAVVDPQVVAYARARHLYDDAGSDL